MPVRRKTHRALEAGYDIVVNRHDRLKRQLKRAETIIEAHIRTSRQLQQEFLDVQSELRRKNESLEQAIEIIGQDGNDIDTFHRVYVQMRSKHGSNMLDINDIHQIEEIEKRLGLDKERWLP